MIGNDADKKDVNGGLTVWENVGIGTPASTTQELKLYVKGYTDVSNLPGPSPASAVVRIEDETYNSNSLPSGNRTAWWDLITSAGNHKFFIKTGNSEGVTNNNIMTFTEDGKVGIGTDYPTEKLHIKGNRFILEENQNTLRFDADNGGVEIGSSTDQISFWYTGVGYNDIKCGNIDLVVGLRVLDGNGDAISKMTSDGKIWAQEVTVVLNDPYPDYVFQNDYKLKSIKDVENYLVRNGHLPGVPTSSEVAKNGLDLGEMNTILLEKIEELTLYVIELKNENIEIRNELNNYKNNCGQ